MEQKKKTKVFVYQLMSPAELVKYSRTIRNLLFGPTSILSGEVFRIDPTSGWIYYENRNKLNRNKKPLELPASENLAVEKARLFIAQHYEKMNRMVKKGQNSNLPAILPRQIKLSSSQLVNNVETGLPDHWLLRFTIWLDGENGFGANMVMLQEGGIDLRIGNKGEIWGMFQRYRPIIKKLAFPMLEAAIIPHEDEHDGHTHGEKATNRTEAMPAEEGRLCYKQEGQNIAQTHYTPLYKSMNGHHANYSSASEFSMQVSIAQADNGGEKLDLSADVKGGYGHYAYQWLVSVLTRPENAIRNFGSGPRISIPKEVCDVSLTVKDLASEQVLQTVITTYPK